MDKKVRKKDKRTIEKERLQSLIVPIVFKINRGVFIIYFE